MRVKRAKELFHGKEGYNCAQAIALAFADKNIQAEDFSSYGGGRAPQNICGAVYAGLSFLDEKQSKIFKQKFAEKTEAITCRELKRVKKVPCTECVHISAEILNEML